MIKLNAHTDVLTLQTYVLTSRARAQCAYVSSKPRVFLALVQLTCVRTKREDLVGEAGRPTPEQGLQ